jgi:guanylate kinase
MKHAKLIILSAPSGAGKSTIVKALIQQLPTLELSVSACTRPPRANEKDGVHYLFLSVEDFKNKIANNEFIEWEMVYEGKYYGTLKSEINRIWQKGHTPILDIDVVGAINVMKLYADSSINIFIQPPSIDELKNRLIHRGTETKDSLQERIAKAEQEMELRHHFEHIVVNDDLETAIQKVKAIIEQT